MGHAVTWGSLFGVDFTVGGLAMVAIGAIGVALSALGIWMLS